MFCSKIQVGSYDAQYKMQSKLLITRVVDWYNGLITNSGFQCSVVTISVTLDNPFNLSLSQFLATKMGQSFFSSRCIGGTLLLGLGVGTF